MNHSDEMVMSYVDGELDEPARAAFERALAGDPELARRVARQQAVRAKLRAAFETTLEEPVPTRLLEAARATPVADLATARARRKRLPAVSWLAMAASLVAGVLIGYRMTSWIGTQPNIAADDGGPTARGDLARALAERLASEQSSADPVRVGLSFLAESGEYCRTFSVRTDTSVAGLACFAADGDWRIRLLEADTAVAEDPGALRQAGSALPDLLREAVEARIAGEPLDADGEALAREQGWRAEHRMRDEAR